MGAIPFWVHPAGRALVALLVVLGVVPRSEASLPLSFNQGIARVAGGWIVSGTSSPVPDTDVLARLDEDLNVVQVARTAIPPPLRAQGYDHIGDVDVVGDVIFAPLEQPSYELGHQAVARYDAATLAFIDSVELPQHENSFVAVEPTTMTAYSMDHFDGQALLRYDIAAGWAPLAPLPLTTTLHHTQGASIAGRSIWIATSDDHNGVYRVDLATGAVTDEGTLGHQAAEGEGIDATALPSGALHALINDPAHGTVHLVHLDISDDAGSTAPTSSPSSPSTSASASSASSSQASSGSTSRSSGARSGLPGWLVASAVASVVAGLGLVGLSRRGRG